MGSVLVCIGCYCCLYSIRPKFVEWLAFGANLIEIAFLIWGIVDIPWDDLNTGSKVLYYITCGIVIITFILTIVLIILRCGGSINTTKNGAARCLCISAIVFDIIAFIIIIIDEILILHKMWDIDGDSYYRHGRYRYETNDYFSDTEWAAAGIVTSAAEIGIAAHFYCISFLVKLIYLKTDLSYNEYLETTNNRSVGVISNTDSDGVQGTIINVYNTPPPNNASNMTFLGYDKDGHPIYAGNNQYRTINVPQATPQPNVNLNVQGNQNIIADNTRNNNIK